LLTSTQQLATIFTITTAAIATTTETTAASQCQKRPFAGPTQQKRTLLDENASMAQAERGGFLD